MLGIQAAPTLWFVVYRVSQDAPLKAGREYFTMSMERQLSQSLILTDTSTSYRKYDT